MGGEVGTYRCPAGRYEFTFAESPYKLGTSPWISFWCNGLHVGCAAHLVKSWMGEQPPEAVVIEEVEGMECEKDLL